jgi:hypothetical protein
MNKFATFSQRNSDIPDSNWEDTNANETEAYIVVLKYGNCGSTNSRIFLWRHLYIHHCKTDHDTKIVEKNWHLNDEEHKLEPTYNNYDIPIQARPASDVLKKIIVLFSTS